MWKTSARTRRSNRVSPSASAGSHDHRVGEAVAVSGVVCNSATFAAHGVIFPTYEGDELSSDKTDCFHHDVFPLSIETELDAAQAARNTSPSPPGDAGPSPGTILLQLQVRCSSSRYAAPAPGTLFQLQVRCSSSRYVAPAPDTLFQLQVRCSSSMYATPAPGTLLQLQHNTTEGGWWHDTLQRGALLSAAAGISAGLLVLLLLLFFVALYSRKKNKTKNTRSGDAETTGHHEATTKHSLVTVDPCGHKAQLLPSVESLNQSPFDKDFSFDFATDLGGSIGYHPATYTVDPPCPRMPPCSSPCHCWHREEDSGVETEETTATTEGKGFLSLKTENETDVTNLKIAIKNGADNKSPYALQPSELHEMFVEGFACLRVITDPGVHKITSPGAETTMSFSSFRTTSTPTTERRTSSLSLPLKESPVCNRAMLQKENYVGKSSTSPSIYTNNNDVRMNYNVMRGTKTLKTFSDASMLKKREVCKQIEGSAVHYCVEASPPAALDKLDLSSDSGFCDITPNASPFSHCYKTLPSLKSGHGIKCIPEERMSSFTGPFKSEHDKSCAFLHSGQEDDAAHVDKSCSGQHLNFSHVLNVDSWTRSLPSRTRRKYKHQSADDRTNDTDEVKHCMGRTGNSADVVVYRQRTAL
ncbi:hypothetical protein FHG87_002690 [Trinorchestia longiramus]|nr:hypothetical protein FHG87_002690 [Trinorchestia longiramus]